MGQDTATMVVVGAGLAGLAGATLLARQGHDVTVLERRAEPGGRAASHHIDGFTLNLGPHALAMSGPGTAVLEELGIDLPGGNPLSRPPSFFLDGEVVGLGRLRGGPSLPRFVAGVGRIAAGARRHAEPEGTVAAWLDTLSGDDRTRAALAALARLALYADAESAASADYFAEASRGGAVRYLDGGWGGLVERLRRAASAAGVQFVHGVARSIVVSAGRVQGVEVDDGRVLPAQGVLVAAGSPAAVAGLLPGDLSVSLRRVAEGALAARMACLDVALGGDVVPGLVALGLDEPTYLSVQSGWSRIAPDGVGGVVQVARFLRPGEDAPPSTRADLEAVLTRVVPDWRDRVVHARFLPGLTVTHHLPTAAEGGLAARHPATVSGLDGVALAGDWVGPRGTLAQAALASAAAAAEVLGAGAREPERVA